MDEKFIRERITQLRIARNVSEYQMSAELGKSASYVQAITSGRSLPSVERLFNIIDYFGLTPAEFFNAEDGDSQEVRTAIHLLRALDAQSVASLLPLLRRLAEQAGPRETPET